MNDKSGKLTARELPVAQLSDATREAMWRVFARYYAGIHRDTFERDLAAKQNVITLLDSGDGSLQGFSTVEVYDQQIDGRRVVAIFSGDTIVEKEYWGQKALQTAFFVFILKTKLANPTTPLYWFLISKGYKTYLLLSRNFVEYWPRHDAATPAWQTKLVDALARNKFGDAWDADAGVLRMDGRDGRLKQGVAPVDQSALAHPDIRFFVTKNPNYVAGDELVCVGLVDLKFALAYAAKQLRRALGVGRDTEREWASETARS